MPTHILIPTDGSDLSAEAIQYGTALAKAVNARVTGVTVSTPFHIFAVELDTIQDTLESYRQRMTTIAAQRLDKVKEAAEAADVIVQQGGGDFTNGLLHVHSDDVGEHHICSFHDRVLLLNRFATSELE